MRYLFDDVMYSDYYDFSCPRLDNMNECIELDGDKLVSTPRSSFGYKHKCKDSLHKYMVGNQRVVNGKIEVVDRSDVGVELVDVDEQVNFIAINSELKVDGKFERVKVAVSISACLPCNVMEFSVDQILELIDILRKCVGHMRRREKLYVKYLEYMLKHEIYCADYHYTNQKLKTFILKNYTIINWRESGQRGELVQHCDFEDFE